MSYAPLGHSSSMPSVLLLCERNTGIIAIPCVQGRVRRVHAVVQYLIFSNFPLSVWFAVASPLDSSPCLDKNLWGRRGGGNSSMPLSYS